MSACGFPKTRSTNRQTFYFFFLPVTITYRAVSLKFQRALFPESSPSLPRFWGRFFPHHPHHTVSPLDMSETSSFRQFQTWTTVNTLRENCISLKISIFRALFQNNQHLRSFFKNNIMHLIVYCLRNSKMVFQYSRAIGSYVMVQKSKYCLDQ